LPQTRGRWGASGVDFPTRGGVVKFHMRQGLLLGSRLGARSVVGGGNNNHKTGHRGRKGGTGLGERGGGFPGFGRDSGARGANKISCHALGYMVTRPEKHMLADAGLSGVFPMGIWKRGVGLNN